MPTNGFQCWFNKYKDYQQGIEFEFNFLEADTLHSS